MVGEPVKSFLSRLMSERCVLVDLPALQGAQPGDDVPPNPTRPDRYPEREPRTLSILWPVT